ncbi:helix-turn-helix domain-containing protein [Floridanema evergladense]|uniref:Helix-turn-helix domain-containing protein n=1 Tax=Floridaenema evergladense BLCC-F167 TaxID=3153639 RepID=A0ABV4WCY6_9CYAN
MNNYPYIEIGKKIRHARQEKELSQRQLAKLAGTTQGEIWQIEQGKRYRIDYFLLCKISEVLEIKIPTLSKVG